MKSCSVFIIILLNVLCIVSSTKPWHPLLKRQGGICSSGEFLTRICTNGYYEDYAYIAAQCNQSELAKSISDTCRTNENGVVCSAFDTDTSLQQFTSTCGLFFTDNTCSEECHSFLTDARARYGCCINIYNNTELFIASKKEAITFSYPLWSRCGVEPVTEECAPSSFAMPTEIDPYCIDDVLLQRLTFRVLCRMEFLNDLRDFAASCTQNTEDLVDSTYCLADENGKHCSLIEDIFSADLIASTNCPDTSMCDPFCIETLTNFTNKFGCCFISELNSTSNTSRYLSYEFWEMCGLTSPGFCNFKFDYSISRISTAAAVILKISAQAVLLVTAIALILMN